MKTWYNELDETNEINNYEIKKYIQTEDYNIAKTFIACFLFCKLTAYTFNWIGALCMIPYVTTLVPSLIFLLRGEIYPVKVIIFVLTCILPVVCVEIPCYRYAVIVLPIFTVTFPLYSLMVVRSLPIAVVTFIVNALASIYHFKSIVYQAGFKDNMEKLVVYCVEGGIMILLAFLTQQRTSRSNVIELFKQKEQLLDLNNRNQTLNMEQQCTLKSKDEFLLGVSHELRNPLNILQGHIELALMSCKDVAVQTVIHSAKSSCELLSSLINNLLDAGKLKSNNLEISLTPTNMQIFIEKIWSTMKMLLQRRNLDGQVYVSKNIPLTLNLDPHRVMQVIYNLVSNSAKFTIKGGITIIISWVPKQDYHDDMVEEDPQELFNAGFSSCNTGVQHINEKPCRSEKTLLNLGSPIQSSGDLNDTEELKIGSSGEYSNNKSVPYTYSLTTKYKSLAYLELMKDYYRLDYNSSAFAKVQRSASGQDLALQSSGFLRIEIRDTGCGMTENQLESLYQKFSQTGSKQLGTGLGLWITQNLCKSMGGNIKAYSKKSEGSTFVVVLKCERCFESTSELNTSPSKLKNSVERALVVDDLTSNRDIHKYFLEQCKVQVADVASNGLEAVEIFKKRGKDYFDVIFMDLDMPVMNGELASEKIRKYERQHGWNSPVTLVIITGHGRKEECDRVLDPQGAIRADYVFVKPFGYQQCNDLITKLRSKAVFTLQQESMPTLMHMSEESSNIMITPTKRSKLGRCKVLVVDDEQSVRKAMQEFLGKLGIGCIIAHNGRDAMDKWVMHQSEVGLIVMDSELPGMNGCLVTEKIRMFCLERKWPKVPICGLMSCGDKVKPIQCFESGMDVILVKPISLTKFREVIESFIPLKSREAMKT